MIKRPKNFLCVQLNEFYMQQEKQDRLHNEMSAAVANITESENKQEQPSKKPVSIKQEPELKQAEIVSAQPQMTPQERMEQFQELMTQIVRNAMTDNNKDLSKDIGTEVGDRVLKEMNYLMRMQDEQEEERFKKLDEAIRSYGKRHKRISRKKKKEKPAIKTVPRLE